MRIAPDFNIRENLLTRVSHYIECPAYARWLLGGAGLRWIFVLNNSILFHLQAGRAQSSYLARPISLRIANGKFREMVGAYANIDGSFFRGSVRY